MICSNLEILAEKKRYGCQSGQCQESTTGEYTESTCGGNCAPITPSSGTSTAIIAAVGIGLAYILFSGKKGRK